MKDSARLLLIAPVLLFSTLALAQTPAPSAEQTMTTTTTTHILRSDDLAIGDPLGNRGVSPKADAGPANTQTYCPEGSAAEHCVRATRRHNSSTTWQHDCATGLSRACGHR